MDIVKTLLDLANKITSGQISVDDAVAQIQSKKIIDILREEVISKLNNNFSKLKDLAKRFADQDPLLAYYIAYLSYETAKAIKNRFLQWYSASTLAEFSLVLARYPQAIKLYQEALTVFEELNYQEAIGAVFNNLGVVYFSLSQYQDAINHHEEALKIAQEVGNRGIEGVAFGNLGNIYHSLGQFQKAIDCYEKALNIANEIGDRDDENKWLNNLGLAYKSLGQYQKAIDYFERALKIAGEIGNKNSEGRWFGSLGNAYSSLGQYQKAIDYFEKGLKIAREIGDIESEGNHLGNLGIAYSSLGQFKEAIDYHERALKIAVEIGNRQGEGNWLGNLGNAYGSLSQDQKAIDYYERALKIAQEIGDVDAEWIANLNLGIVYDDHLLQPDKAYEHYRRSIELLGEMRGLMTEGEDKAGLEHKAGLVSRGIEAYDRIVLNLVAQERHNEAIEYVERAKAQNLVELLNKERILPAVHTQEYEKALLDYKEAEFQQKRAINQDKGSQEKAKANLKSAKDALDPIVEKIRKDDPYFAAVFKIEPIGFNRIERLIPDDGKTAIVEFFVTDKATLAFVVIPGKKLEETTLKIDEFKLSDLNKIINSWIVSYYDYAKVAWHKTIEETSKTLYERLFYQIDKRLTEYGIERIILIPHRGLHLLPIHSLFYEVNGSRKYLCDRYEISYSPSSQVLALCQTKRGRNKSSLLAIANPDKTLKWAGFEVEKIAKHFTSREILWHENGTSAAVMANAPEYEVIHFSCHGMFDIAKPLNSCLALADGYLTLKDIFEKLRLPRTGMVVLSACETGITQLDKSDEYVGLPSGFLYAGSPVVIGSLWSVDDLSTALLMGKFYDNLFLEKLSPAEALSKAQEWLRELTTDELTREIGDDEIGSILKKRKDLRDNWQGWTKYKKVQRILRRKEEPVKDERLFSHPYYWAGFFAAGNCENSLSCVKR